MSVDKLVDSTQLDADLTSVANAIRAKSGGSGSLAFPSGFVSEIGNISGGGDTLPSGYTACNYIQSSGDAYIDTGVWEVPGATSGFHGRFAASNAGSNIKYLFGYQGIASGAVSKYRICLFVSTSNTLQYYGATSGASSTLGGWSGSGINEITVSLTQNATYPVFNVNGTQTTGNKLKTTEYSNAVGTIYLMANNYQASGPSTVDTTVDGSWIRCYGFEIYMYGGAVRKFVPCVRDSDSVAGFYDYCSEAFYPSIGGNAFTYG